MVNEKLVAINMELNALLKRNNLELVRYFATTEIVDRASGKTIAGFAFNDPVAILQVKEHILNELKEKGYKSA